MSKPNRPTLIYPNGNDKILSRIIDISWQEAIPASTDGLPIWYEIVYAEYYDGLDEPNWNTIAVVPQGTKIFQWKIGNYFNNKEIRVGIRAVNSRGERSDYSISASNILLKRSNPSTPSVVNPVPGGRYGGSIDILLDESSIEKTSSQRSRYYIYFSSNKLNIPLSPVIQGVPIGAGPLTWDTSLLKPSDDYVLTVWLADDSGNKSIETNIENINIVNEGFFLIDTKPPSGYIQVNGGDDFTKTRDVSVNLFAYDETSGLQSMQFIENDISKSPESYINFKYYKISEEEGSKVIKVLFQDYGYNRTNQVEKSFRTIFDLSNSDIADISLDGETLWVGCNADDASYLYRIDDGSALVGSVSESINALGILNSIVYISCKTEDGTALIYRYNGYTIEECISLTDIASEIKTMDSYKGSLYMGSVGGNIYKYDESSVTLLSSFGSSIHKVYSDSSLLYILFNNKSSIVIYDGSNFSEVQI